MLNIDEELKIIEEIFGYKGRTKILYVLSKYGELNISKIASVARMNLKSAKKHLDVLVNLGLIKEKRFGRILIYSYMTNNAKAIAIKKVFEICSGTA